MEILERKKPPSLIGRCPHCSSKLEIEKGDIVWHKDIDGGNSPYMLIVLFVVNVLILKGGET